MRPEYWLYTIPLRLRSLFRRATADQELDDELRDHLEQKTEEYVAQGMTQEQAHRRARLDLEGVEQTKQKCRDTRGVTWVQDFIQDLNFGLRMLRKSPGFTAIAVVTLTLGIGANTAIFNMVNALVLRPLPVHAPNEIASLAEQLHGGGSSNGFSYPDFADIRKQTTSVFRDMAGTQPSHNMDGFSMNGQSQPIWMSYVTTNFFQVIGITPALGSFFQPSGERIDGSDPRLVLSYSFWKNHLGGDPTIVGRSASINGRSVTIIGVAAEGFTGVWSVLDTQGYLPVGMATATLDSPKDFLTNRSVASVTILGRLQPGMKVSQAQPVLAVVGRQLSEQYPEIHKWDWLEAFPGGPLNAIPQDKAVMESMAAFFLLLVGLVLVLACLNVANLFLVRAAARQGEMAVRAAFGAGRGRLVRQFLTESLLLAALGCVGGIVVGVAASRSVNSINFTATPFVFNVTLDWRVLAYAVGAALLTGLLVGVTPAIRAARGDLNAPLHESSRTATGRRQRARTILVVAELSGSLMLLIIAGLFVRSLRSVEHTDLGFDPDHVFNMTISPIDAGYDEAQAGEFLQQLFQRARVMPGVESASLAATIPMGYYNYGEELKIAGYKTPPGQQPPFAGYNAVSAGYFRTMRIPLVRGREFLDSDGHTSPDVAVVNEEMARSYWPNQDSIGRLFTAGKDSTHPIQVIGVVKNSRSHRLTGSLRPYFYRPFAQHYMAPVTLQLRTALPAATVFHQAADLIHSLAPAMPVFDVQTMTQALDTLHGLLLYKVGAALTASLGTLGLLLGLVGVYGVVSYAASQRTHEIGVRMALGAAPSSVLKMMLRQGLIVTVPGVLVGALLASAIGRLARDLLAGVSPMDPLTFACASGLLAAVSLLACYIPARRAMKVDPIVALRYE